MNARKPLTALFLGAPNPLSMGMIAAWLHAGNRIEAIWYPERVKATPAVQKDIRMADTNPYLSMAGLARLFEVNCEAVPKMSESLGLVTRAKGLSVDVIISVMFMDIIPKAIIAAFKGRLLNIHPSLLPAYRGPTPILSMLWDEKINEFSGLTLHEVAAGVDEGAIVKSSPVAFPGNGSMVHYLGALIPAGGKLLCETVPAYLAGSIVPTGQPRHGVSYCHVKIGQLSIAPTNSRARVEWLCRTVGQFGEFRIKGAIADVRVNRLVEVLGPPTGAQMAFSDNWAEIDLADARVRLASAERFFLAVSHFVSKRHRLRPIFERMTRAGATNIDIVAADEGSKLDEMGGFDCVLIDAPCSGSGSWRTISVPRALGLTYSQNLHGKNWFL